MTNRFSFTACPVAIRRTAWLMWTSLLLGALTQLGERLLLGPGLPPEGTARLLAFVALAYGLSGWVVWELARGRPWARIALSAWFVLSLAAWVMMVGEPGRLWQHVADIAVLLLDAAGLWLAWTGSGAAWFRQQAAAADEAAGIPFD